MALSKIVENSITDGAVAAAKLKDFSAAVDLNGVELILDADQDTSITADTDDRIDFKIANVEHFSFSNSSGDTVVKPMVDAKDIIFQQYDGNKLFEINDGNFVSVGGNAAAGGEIRIYEDTDLGTNYTGFKAGNLTGSVAYQLPLADGSSGQALTTDSNGVLSWSTIATNTPTSANGQALGSAALEWSDLFLADGAVINFGADQDTNITHVADTGLTTNRDFTVGDDLFVSGGVLDLKNTGAASRILLYCEFSNAHAQTLQSQPHSAGATNTSLLPTGASSSLVSLVSADILTNKTLTSPVINTGTFGTSILPTSADGTTLGSASKEFSDLFLADASTIQFGNDQDVTLTHVADAGIMLNTEMQLRFRDSAISIGSPADGDLDINADDEIELNSTLIDINGNVEISGTLAQVGVATFTARDIHSGGITIANDGTIGSVGDADSIAISSAGVVTMTQIPVLSAGLNVSGGTIAGTLATAAQGNVTSLGTLTALTVDDVAVDGKVITMTGSSGDTFVTTVAANGATSLVTTDAAAAAAHLTITADGTVDIDSAGVLTLDSGAAINIEPAAGSAILLDGTISVDAGVVTGATSITSTAFVGGLTGNVTGNASGTALTVTQAAQTAITSVGTLTALTTSGVLDLTGTTDSSDASGDTGILRVEGGASIAKKLYIGTDLDVDGTANLDIVDIDGAVNMAAALTLNNSLAVSHNSGVAAIIANSASSQLALRLDQTHASEPYGMVVDFTSAAPNNTTNYFILCEDSSAARFKVFSSGQVQTPGVLFGSDTAAANSLNDYEEGTFTVTLAAAGGGTFTLNGDQNLLVYTKIGNLVSIGGRIKVDSISSPSGEVSINGLPFSAAHGSGEGTNHQNISVHFRAASSDVGGVTGQTSTNAINIYEAGTTGNTDVADKIDGGTYIMVGGVYRTSA